MNDEKSAEYLNMYDDEVKKIEADIKEDINKEVNDMLDIEESTVKNELEKKIIEDSQDESIQEIQTIESVKDEIKPAFSDYEMDRAIQKINNSTDIGEVEMSDIDDSMEVNLPDIDFFEIEENSDVIENECDYSIDYCFIGCGQGGGRIAEAFWNLGYRKVCCINTSTQDLNGVNIPEENKLHLERSEGGAGKDPRKGKDAIINHREEVRALMEKCFGSKWDRIIVTSSAGGGTGTGCTKTALEISREMHEAYGIDDSVGAFISIPQKKEGKVVNANAHVLLDEVLFKQEEEELISPLVIIDNEKMFDIYGKNVPVSKFWPLANQSVAAIFHVLNALPSKDSEYTSFDRSDYKSIIDSGTLIFGATPIKSWKSGTDISLPIKESFNNNILADGFDLNSATHACLVLVGGQNVLDEVSMDTLNYAFDMVDNKTGKNTVLHRGIYKSKKPNLMAYTMIGGLDKPTARLEELKRIADR